MLKSPILGIACLLGLGCADRIPPELVDARRAYDRAQAGPAAVQTPAELHMAEVALQKANATFEGEGNTCKARDRAYIAGRKVRIAEIHARTIASEQRTAKVSSETERLEDGALKRLGSAEQALKNQGQELAAERTRREEADKRAEQARSDLARVATVGETERGTVITLPGGVLFASGKSKLLPTALAKLSLVANALISGNPDANMTVEGHTDAQGPAEYNMRLSQSRAEAVRTYLVSHGIAGDRISAEGLGESSPIAENASPEGRANNRRVEIVVGTETLMAHPER